MSYDLDCTCLKGTCDNSIASTGSCVLGSCEAGYTGPDCDVQETTCNGITCPMFANCTETPGGNQT